MAGLRGDAAKVTKVTGRARHDAVSRIRDHARDAKIGHRFVGCVLMRESFPPIGQYEP
jgi:hypothetical protein